MFRPFRFFLFLLPAFLAATTSGEVVRIQIDRREPFAPGIDFGTVGGYERITGRFYLAVSPLDPINERIVDLKLAPRNREGKVEFWTDFCLLKPVDIARGNRRLFYDVNNRGNKLALGAFNNQSGNDPRSAADAGNGFLMRHGYTILWCGWNGDVLPGDNRLLIGLPVATNNGETITGRVHAEVIVNDPAFSQPLYWGNSNPYPSATRDAADAVLTMRPRRSEPAITIPRESWAFARYQNGQVLPDPAHLYVKEGFRPGWLYDLVYTARDPRVTGLGLAAVRDVVSFLRHDRSDVSGTPNPLAGAVEKTIIFGISQSGRFIHHFVWQGFNSDVHGRIVFDGAFAHVAGGGKGYFNHRFAQTTRHGSQHEDNLSPSEVFPFTTTPQTYPQTGEAGDTLQLARQQNCVPKFFFTQTSTEYWCRGASLLHTDVDGKADVPLDDTVRLYFLCGAQHGNTRSTAPGIFQYLPNTLDHRPVLRALLPALDRWLTRGTEPPASRYPTIAAGTLVSFQGWKAQMSAATPAALPAGQYVPLRLDFGPRWNREGIADIVPPRVTGTYTTLLPAVDSDGNEVGGIRLPDVAAPLGVYTGWNLRGEPAGAAGALGRWAGSFQPFARTAAERPANDRRLSVRERYPTPEVYLARRIEAIRQVASAGFLLDEDVVSLVQESQLEGSPLWKE